MTTTSTEPRITIAIKPVGTTEDGTAYTHMTYPEARTFIADIQLWLAKAEEGTSPPTDATPPRILTGRDPGKPNRWGGIK